MNSSVHECTWTLKGKHLKPFTSLFLVKPFTRFHINRSYLDILDCKNMQWNINIRETAKSGSATYDSS